MTSVEQEQPDKYAREPEMIESGEPVSPTKSAVSEYEFGFRGAWTATGDAFELEPIATNLVALTMLKKVGRRLAA